MPLQKLSNPPSYILNVRSLISLLRCQMIIDLLIDNHVLVQCSYEVIMTSVYLSGTYLISITNSCKNTVFNGNGSKKYYVDFQFVKAIMKAFTSISMCAKFQFHGISPPKNQWRGVVLLSPHSLEQKQDQNASKKKRINK